MTNTVIASSAERSLQRMKRTVSFSYRSLGRFIFSTVLLTLSLSLISCDRGVPKNVLRFSHFWSEPGQRAVMDSVIAQFKTEHPEIEVEVSELSWGDGKTKLMINFNAQTAPDVIEFGSDWVPEFSASGVLENLSNYDSLRARVAVTPEYAQECGTWEHHTFAVPWFVDTRVLFINDDLINIIDSTARCNSWNAMLTLGKAVQASGKGNGIGVNGSDVHRLYKKILPQIWSNGGAILDSNGNPTFDRPENIEALAFYVSQLDGGVLETQKNLDDLFKRGKLAILFSGSWLLNPLKKSEFKWHCEPFPGNNSHPGISFAGGEYLAINASSAMKREAKELLAFLTRPDIELRLAKAFSIFPATTILQSDPYYLHRDQGTVFIAQLQQARMTPVHPKWLEIEAILEDETAQALYKKKTPAEAMASANARVRTLINEP